jgi:hypothetical protein
MDEDELMDEMARDHEEWVQQQQMKQLYEMEGN